MPLLMPLEVSPHGDREIQIKWNDDQVQILHHKGLTVIAFLHMVKGNEGIAPSIVQQERSPCILVCFSALPDVKPRRGQHATPIATFPPAVRSQTGRFAVALPQGRNPAVQARSPALPGLVRAGPQG